jgi:hypothetical protein
METALQLPTDFVEVPELLPQDVLTIAVPEVQIATAGIIICKAPGMRCIDRNWCQTNEQCYYKKQSQ